MKERYALNCIHIRPKANYRSSVTYDTETVKDPRL